MQITLAMLAGLGLGAVLFRLTRKRPTVAVCTALGLGLIASLLFVATINGWFLPQLGRMGAIGIGALSGIATAVATGSIIRGERGTLNWLALVVSMPPVLFLLVFGAAELLGPPH